RRRAGSRPACASASGGPGPRGSGSSRSRCPGTPPSDGGTRCRSSGGAGSTVRWRSSALQEGQPVLADLELVAVVELCGLDAFPVHERAVQAALVLDEPAALPLPQDGVLAGDGHVV